MSKTYETINLLRSAGRGKKIGRIILDKQIATAEQAILAAQQELALRTKHLEDLDTKRQELYQSPMK